MSNSKHTNENDSFSSLVEEDGDDGAIKHNSASFSNLVEEDGNEEAIKEHWRKQKNNSYARLKNDTDFLQNRREISRKSKKKRKAEKEHEENERRKRSVVLPPVTQETTFAEHGQVVAESVVQLGDKAMSQMREVARNSTRETSVLDVAKSMTDFGTKLGKNVTDFGKDLAKDVRGSCKEAFDTYNDTHNNCKDPPPVNNNIAADDSPQLNNETASVSQRLGRNHTGNIRNPPPPMAVTHDSPPFNTEMDSSPQPHGPNKTDNKRKADDCSRLNTEKVATSPWLGREVYDDLRFSSHAKERMVERNITVDEVRRALKFGKEVPNIREGTSKYESGDVSVVVATDDPRRVVTVWDTRERDAGESSCTQRPHKKARRSSNGATESRDDVPDKMATLQAKNQALETELAEAQAKLRLSEVRREQTDSRHAQEMQRLLEEMQQATRHAQEMQQVQRRHGAVMSQVVRHHLTKSEREMQQMERRHGAAMSQLVRHHFTAIVGQMTTKLDQMTTKLGQWRDARNAERSRATRERTRADEERRRADEAHRRADEERRRADEERRRADQADEERRRAEHESAG